MTLTEEGLALIERALPDHVDTEHRLLSVLTPERRQDLADILRDLLESLGDTTDAV